jgi:hypothetical protein
MKGQKIEGHTASKIEAHIRKHRATGGKTVEGKGKESPMNGKDDADRDLKTKPKDRSNTGGGKDEIGKEAEAKSERGAKFRKGGFAHVEKKGEDHMAHGGRRARKSGGACEDNPFTSASRATPPKGHKVERLTEGKDED